jgi:hypothetical protein
MVGVSMTARRGWPEDVREACFRLWCDTGHNASRVARLYRQDLPDDTPGPAPSTVRRWSVEERWRDWAGDEVPHLPGQNLDQWTTIWRRHVLRHVDAALRAQRDHLLGTFDNPAAAEGSLTEAEGSMTHLFAQPGVHALLRIAFSEEEAPPVFVANRERQAWERLVQGKTVR